MADVENEPTKLGEAAPDEVIDKALAESDRYFRKLDAALDRIIQGAAHGKPIESGEAVSDEEWNTMSDGEFYTRLSAVFGRRLASEMDKITDEDSAESGQCERENPTES
jgi:hypothetical protein